MGTTTKMTADEITAAASELAGGLVALTLVTDTEGPQFYRLAGHKAHADGSGGGGSLDLRPPAGDSPKITVFYFGIVELRDMTDAEFTAQGWGF